MGYDMCSDLRDSYNAGFGDYRYFCSERFKRDANYSYNWNTSDSFYSDVYDNDFNTYYDDQYYDDQYGDYQYDNDYYDDQYSDDWSDEWRDDWNY